MEGTGLCLIDTRYSRVNCDSRKYRSIVNEDRESIIITDQASAMLLDPPLVAYNGEKCFSICTMKFQKPNKCRYFHLLPIAAGKINEQQIIITAGI